MKSVIAHGVLALLGLVFAYSVWAHEEKEEPVPGEIVIADCDPQKLALVEVESSSNRSTYRALRHGSELEYWVTTEAKKPKADKSKDDKDKADKDKKDDKAGKPTDTKAEPAKDAKNDKLANDAANKKGDDKNAKPAEPAKPERPKQPRYVDPYAPVNFRANQRFDETVKTLAPLRGVRELGVIPKAKLKDFGLDKGAEGVVLREQCGDRKIELQVGGRTYGSGDSYVRDPKTNQVYLMHGQTLLDLQSAMYRFMQTDLHNFTLPDIDEAIIKADGKERKLLHRNRQVPAEARWVDAKEPDKRNELFGNYFQKLARLKARSYLPEGKEPGSDLLIETEGTTPVLTIDYQLEGKPKGKFELVKVKTKQGNFYYARTETTKRWTVMYDSLAKQVEDDAASVVGSEEQPAQNQSLAPETPATNPHATPATPAPGTNPHALPAPPASNPHALPAPSPHAAPPTHPPSH